MTHSPHKSQRREVVGGPWVAVGQPSCMARRVEGFVSDAKGTRRHVTVSFSCTAMNLQMEIPLQPHPWYPLFLPSGRTQGLDLLRPLMSLLGNNNSNDDNGDYLNVLYSSDGRY